MNFNAHRDEHIDSQMIKIEVNLDDMPGEMLGYLMDKLLQAGANDVFYTPIYMKKNRPAVLMQLLCDESLTDSMKEILFTETTTLGIRYYPLSVHRLERRFIKTLTPWGEVTIKEGRFQGKLVQQSPEYEDCRKLAEENQIPLKKIYQYINRRMADLP
ncbi:LarC family nickel insertion protein [Evansella sp. LMS18]|uniref:nickel insertion protein n=1 Tax=Evansella sp. LMS18 TaxID=2924033 RepID=UPI0020D15B35|nr:nickel insertion protein [Evansella sp. LMS18]UTR11921.1 LarC family nickel insertion protein [Evansella sp. LMS18]